MLFHCLKSLFYVITIFYIITIITIIVIYYKEEKERNLSHYIKKKGINYNKKVRNKEREGGGAIKQYYGLFTYHS